MADRSAIEWTDATWNPVAGCTIVSRGCSNCYAMQFARRLAAMGQEKYKGLTRRSGGRAVWTGDVTCDPAALAVPLRWRRPRFVFVNAMGDLFHEAVPDDFIREVWNVMDQTPHHTYQILTKRPERMAALTQSLPVLPNVWLGTSIEDRATLARLSHLRRVRAAVRWVSFEPLLEDLGSPDLSGLDWAVVGGESGPRHRPLEEAWVDGIRLACEVAQVPFFFKQWGGKRAKAGGRLLHGRTWDACPAARHEPRLRRGRDVAICASDTAALPVAVAEPAQPCGSDVPESAWGDAHPLWLRPRESGRAQQQPWSSGLDYSGEKSMGNDKSNSGRTLDAIARRIRRGLDRFRRGSIESLAAAREVGEGLGEAKEVMEEEDFLAWAWAEFKIRRAWAFKLMALHKHREAVEAALEWVKDRPDVVEALGNVLTVEKVLKLVKIHQNEGDEAPSPESNDGAPNHHQEPVQQTETPTTRLKRERDEAVAVSENLKDHIAVLESRLRARGIEPPPHEAVEAEVAQRVRAQADAAEIERAIASAGRVAAAPPPQSTAKRKKHGAAEPRSGKRRRPRRPNRPVLLLGQGGPKHEVAVRKLLARKLRTKALRKVLGPKLQAKAIRKIHGRPPKRGRGNRSPRPTAKPAALHVSR